MAGGPFQYWRGAISTPIWTRGGAAAAQIAVPPEAAERYAPILEAAAEMGRNGIEKGLPPEAVAEVVLATLTEAHPPPRQVVGRDAKIMAAMVRLLPFRVLYRLQGARRRG